MSIENPQILSRPMTACYVLFRFCKFMTSYKNRFSLVQYLRIHLESQVTLQVEKLAKLCWECVFVYTRDPHVCNLCLSERHIIFYKCLFSTTYNQRLFPTPVGSCWQFEKTKDVTNPISRRHWFFRNKTGKLCQAKSLSFNTLLGKNGMRQHFI